MTTMAGMLAPLAATATPWAWFPALAVMTPLLALLRRQVGDPEPGSSQLERARVLKELRLEIDVATEHAAQRVRVDEPRVIGDALQHLPRSLHVGNRDHGRPQ